MSHAAALLDGPIPAHLLADAEEMFPMGPPSTGGTQWEAMSEGSSPGRVMPLTPLGPVSGR